MRWELARESREAGGTRPERKPCAYLLGGCGCLREARGWRGQAEGTDLLRVFSPLLFFRPHEAAGKPKPSKHALTVDAVVRWSQPGVSILPGVILPISGLYGAASARARPWACFIGVAWAMAPLRTPFYGPYR